MSRYSRSSSSPCSKLFRGGASIPPRNRLSVHPKVSPPLTKEPFSNSDSARTLLPAPLARFSLAKCPSLPVSQLAPIQTGRIHFSPPAGIDAQYPVRRAQTDLRLTFILQFHIIPFKSISYSPSSIANAGYHAHPCQIQRMYYIPAVGRFVPAPDTKAVICRNPQNGSLPSSQSWRS